MCRAKKVVDTFTAKTDVKTKEIKNEKGVIL